MTTGKVDIAAQLRLAPNRRLTILRHMQADTPKKVVVIYSGGMDSTVLLYQLVKGGAEVRALSIDYSQRHRERELSAARQIAEGLGISHEVADLRGINHLLAGSSLTSPDIDVPEGHYAEENMKATVVPNRNMIMLSVAAGYAISIQYDAVAYAAHSGDHAIYPDCRNEFADAVDAAIQLADWHRVQLYRPFLDMSKADIAKLGSELKVPLEKTWSCYNGRAKHCGRCGTCIERREAFYLAGMEDFTKYERDSPKLEKLIEKEWKLN